MDEDASTPEPAGDPSTHNLSPSERVEEVASVVSHDLQNPLTIASGYLARARNDGDDEYFEHVEDALDEIRAISDDVVDLARLGQPVQETRPTDFGVVVDSCWRERSPEAGKLVIDDTDPIE